MSSQSAWDSFIGTQKSQGHLVVQPRMGYGSISEMSEGISACKKLPVPCAGTITLDAYTRVNDYETPRKCLASGKRMNGFPIVTHSVENVQHMLRRYQSNDFQIQIRHGTARPQDIFRRMTELGLEVTEGGPLSYCLPYSNVPVTQSVAAWNEACRILVDGSDFAHIETFGGCMLGQLCPPSLLVSLSILECLYFIQLGVPSVSLSYAQGTSDPQDKAAIRVLRKLAEKLLDKVNWHIVFYTYMGVFPNSKSGAVALIKDSAVLAKEAGCERIIVKTVAESKEIPSISDNMEALTLTFDASKEIVPKELTAAEQYYFDVIFEEVSSILEATLNLHSNIGEAFIIALDRGIIDVPFCLHRNNAKKARAFIDEFGALQWIQTGNIPIHSDEIRNCNVTKKITADMFLDMLNYKAAKYDAQ